MATRAIRLLREGFMRIILALSLILVGVAFMPQPAAASLEGSWRGSGIVKYKGGADKLRCRVNFSRVSARGSAKLSLSRR
jgi:hypothetical protein